VDARVETMVTHANAMMHRNEAPKPQDRVWVFINREQEGGAVIAATGSLINPMILASLTSMSDELSSKLFQPRPSGRHTVVATLTCR
jgi:hypothetical protein